MTAGAFRQAQDSLASPASLPLPQLVQGAATPSPSCPAPSSPSPSAAYSSATAAAAPDAGTDDLFAPAAPVALDDLFAPTLRPPAESLTDSHTASFGGLGGPACGNPSASSAFTAVGAGAAARLLRRLKDEAAG